LQIYVQGARSRFHASGPGGTMIRPCPPPFRNSRSAPCERICDDNDAARMMCGRCWAFQVGVVIRQCGLWPRRRNWNHV